MVELEQASAGPPLGPSIKYARWVVIHELDNTRGSKATNMLRVNKEPQVKVRTPQELRSSGPLGQEATISSRFDPYPIRDQPLIVTLLTG
jgi:hypothetical protein